ncbi:hypothetical protein [Actinomadura rupiterrae]|uniref:hypothetical protein n=1 Tax=Actinomadura rupiterrae TaxID=559627 RepID=UPI0020A3D28C|nr:hypothetical protein [Actinomadura rupiterrae]MCP2339152.1 hypothetical protein [Actinomadura rupiterrae]
MSEPIDSKVEGKVVAASSAALVAAFIVGWVVHVLPGLSGLAEPLQAAVTALIVAGLTFAGGWLARHTPR